MVSIDIDSKVVPSRQIKLALLCSWINSLFLGFFLLVFVFSFSFLVVLANQTEGFKLSRQTLYPWDSLRLYVCEKALKEWWVNNVACGISLKELGESLWCFMGISSTVHLRVLPLAQGSLVCVYRTHHLQGRYAHSCVMDEQAKV